MSHIVSVRTQLRDPAAVASACARLGLPAPAAGTATFFTGEARGLLVQLPGWLYPVVLDTTSGDASYDTYEGAWGEQIQLDKLFQAYAVEKAKLEARRRGHTVTEQARRTARSSSLSRSADKWFHSSSPAPFPQLFPEETFMKVIEVVVSPKGETTVQTKGFAGPECRQASRWLETALGEAVVDRVTAEFYAPRATEQQGEVKA
jgi:hypothetical protein